MSGGPIRDYTVGVVPRGKLRSRTPGLPTHPGIRHRSAPTGRNFPLMERLFSQCYISSSAGTGVPISALDTETRPDRWNRTTGVFDHWVTASFRSMRLSG